MLIPTGHRVLIKPEPLEKETEAGIIIVEDERLQKANQMRGVLVAYGDIAWKAFDKDYEGKPWAEVGDQVVYSKFAGKMVEDPLTGEEFVIINDDDIVLVIKDGDNPDVSPRKYPKIKKEYNY